MPIDNISFQLVQWNAKLRLGRPREPPDDAGDKDAKGAGRKKHRQRRGKERTKTQQPNAKDSTTEPKTQPGLKVKTMIVLCRPVRTESVLEIRSDGNMFISRHDLGFHFIFCDPRVFTLIGYEPTDMLGRTAYQFHSPWDAIICKHCAKQLILSGTATSGYYRFLSRTGAWVWMVTQATIVYDTRRCPQYIVCKNYVVSPKLAERDLSRQRKDFNMMKYSGFSLETDPSESIAFTAGNSMDGQNNKSHEKGFNYRGSVSLATLRPKLGDIDPNVMLNQLLTSEQIDVTGNPFHLPRVRKHASSSLTTGESNNGGHHEGKRLTSGPTHNGSDTAISEGNQVTPNQYSSDDVDMLIYGSSLRDPCISNEGSPGSSWSSQQRTLQDLNTRASSPILTSLWGRDEQDIELTASHFSTVKGPSRMDTSSTYDMLTSSALAIDADFSANTDYEESCSKDADDMDGISLGFNTNSLCEDDSVFQRDLFPILTTTNIYSLDFLTALPEPSSTGHSIFQTGLDPPQSIPLTNATSFSDDHDFVFPESNKYTSNCYSSPNSGFHSEAEDLQRMDTPVSFETQELNDSDSNAISKPLNTDQRLSALSTFISSNETNEIRNRKSGSEAPLKTENAQHFLSGPFTPLGKQSSLCAGSEPDTDSLKTKSATNSDSSSTHAAAQRSNRPENVSILKNTLFYGSKFLSSNQMVSQQSEMEKSQSKSHDPPQQLSCPQSTGSSTCHYSPTSGDLTIPPASRAESNYLPRSSEKIGTDFFSNRSDQMNPVGSMEEDEMMTSDSSSLSSVIESGYSNKPCSISVAQISQNTSTLSTSSKLISFIESNTCLETKTSTRPTYTVLKKQQKTLETRSYIGSMSPNSDTLSPALSGNSSDSTPSSSDGEISSRPSLLRTLLDKEGGAIQGPVTYAEWLLQQKLEASVEKRDILESSNSSIFCISNKRAVGKRSRFRRGSVKKSTELPLPKPSHGSIIRYGKEIQQQRKPTTELPLPSGPILNSSNSHVYQYRSCEAQAVATRDEIPASNISADDISLPDDLLDLAVEYCGSMGADQADALLSDFTDNSSFEDNLYSLVGSPAQSKPNAFPQQNSVKVDSARSILEKFPPSPYTNSFSGYFAADKNISKIKTSYLTAAGDVSSLKIDKSLPMTNQVDRNVADSSVQNKRSSISNVSSYPSCGNGRMSLLRAAVTTPDVDKLIEQIPLANPARYGSKASKPGLRGNCAESDTIDSDVIITKVIGFKDNASLEKNRERTLKDSQRMVQNISSTRPGHDKLDSIFSDHIYTASVVNPKTTAPIDISSTTSPSTLDKMPTAVSQKHFLAPKVIFSPVMSTKPTHAASLLNTINVKGTTINSASGKNRFSSSSPVRSPKNAIFTSTASSSSSVGTNSGRIPKSDVSSTEPVSVMIMRKEAHRSRRSKSIAVQTENAPGEVYPEFERSSTDTILYPSASSTFASNVLASRRDQIRSPSSTVGSSSPLSTYSTPAPSPPNMSQLERFLRGYPGFGEGVDPVSSPEGSASSPPSSSPPSGPPTPFLQRLLTGELSKDNYRRLDEQMREDERRQSASSASDNEFS
ncbi:hypoxia-inducible factor 1-alpha [Plakobranchus ocellatus]|uniref:Hypoxia-inducible factor 1-alpha n=1 Tax=Plakobranchus ocellatus TaxID=259542 RepID=A0AAV4B8R8_9GAST|nr:hypoxia-inducible factor 1-alpha [Plakobranchus ocellatus]